MVSIETYNAAVPENLSRIIREHGLKQNYVAEKAGLTEAQLSGIMNGRRVVKISDLLQLSDALGVSVNSLIYTPATQPQKKTGQDRDRA